MMLRNAKVSIPDNHFLDNEDDVLFKVCQRLITWRRIDVCPKIERGHEISSLGFHYYSYV